ncbi:MAG: hypothetical protein HOF76_16155 [Candidatus Scalindua sp.]|jgi:hypothetical protein|nr:hypothetical protein [Candidatus Scalindua sp.]
MRNIYSVTSNLKLRVFSSLIFASLLIAIISSSVYAEVFLKGNYVEVGIHNSFSFGTAGNQPAGYHGNVSNKLGFVADFGKDGWGIGTPGFAGDFFLPGSPEEGWGIEWTTGSASGYHV